MFVEKNLKRRGFYQSPLGHQILSFLCVFILSVMSNSLRPHGLQTTKLLCSWNSLGKNTEVSCHILLQGVFPNQRLKLGLLRCRQMLLHLSYVLQLNCSEHILLSSLSGTNHSHANLITWKHKEGAGSFWKGTIHSSLHITRSFFCKFQRLGDWSSPEPPNLIHHHQLVTVVFAPRPVYNKMLG